VRQTPLQYATATIQAGRFADMPIDGIDMFWLCDSDGRALDGKHYASRDAAATARSKILDKAMKLAFAQTAG
jgi:hypothetical protein